MAWQIAIAAAVGTPVACLLMQRWLEGYAVRTSITLSAMLLPVIVLCIVCFASVISQLLKTARANPVDVLREV